MPELITAIFHCAWLNPVQLCWLVLLRRNDRQKILVGHDVMNSNFTKELQIIAERLELENIEQALYFPKFFQIETTRLCNTSCPYCAIKQWDKSTPFMSDYVFAKVLEELEKYADWVKWVCVARAGEPLLDKKLSQRIADLKKAGIKWVNLSTNAGLLNADKSRELLEAGIDEVMISIDSIVKEEYEKIKVGLKYDTVLNNIRTLFELREAMKPEAMIRIRAVFVSDKSDSGKRVREWEDYWKQYTKSQDRIYMKKAHTWGNQKQISSTTQSEDELYHPCILPWSTLHVTSMGTITLCPMDYDAKMNLGSILDEDLKTIWNNDKLNRIRAIHSSGHRNSIQFCRKCTVFDPESSMEKKE